MDLWSPYITRKILYPNFISLFIPLILINFISTYIMFSSFSERKVTLVHLLKAEKSKMI